MVSIAERVLLQGGTTAGLGSNLLESQYRSSYDSCLASHPFRTSTILNRCLPRCDMPTGLGTQEY